MTGRGPDKPGCAVVITSFNGVFDRPPRMGQKVGHTRERLVRLGIKNMGNGAELHR
jgi:hypothetical protein